MDFEDLPLAIRRLNSGYSQAFIDQCRSVDMTRYGSGRKHHIHSSLVVDADEDDEQQRRNTATPISVNDRPSTEGRIVSINEFPLKQFRSMLVEHFNCQYVQSKVVWPKRLAARPRHVPTNYQEELWFIKD